MRVHSAFLSLWPWLLTFDLDIQTRTSEGPNTSSCKSIQPFPNIWCVNKIKKSQTALKQNLTCVRKKNRQSSEVRPNFQTEVPLFLKISECPYNTMLGNRWQLLYQRKQTSSIHSAVLIQYRPVTDGRTDKQRATAYTGAIHMRCIYVAWMNKLESSGKSAHLCQDWSYSATQMNFIDFIR